MKKTYEVTISRTDTFTVEASDEDEAIEIAFEMWDNDNGNYCVESEVINDEN